MRLNLSTCDDERQSINREVGEEEEKVVAADSPNYARKLGIQQNQVVQELGWDEDTDDDIRVRHRGHVWR